MSFDGAKVRHFFNPTILFSLFFLQIPHLLTFVISSPISLTLVNVTLNNTHLRPCSICEYVAQVAVFVKGSVIGEIKGDANREH